MRILISGSSGLIGSALVPALTKRGHDVTRLVRTSAEVAGGVVWNPEAGMLDLSRQAPFDAVIHLAGENIGAKRWTASRKVRLRESRTKGTALVAEMIARMEPPPALFISASAIGYYGDRGDEVLTEENKAGSGFLAELCQEWEAAAQPARKAGIRTVCIRTGMVLASHGGALPRMLPLFKLGLGGRLGNGRQYMSWITLEDVVGAILHILFEPRLAGPVNLVSPHPVTNSEFTKVLAGVLHRPAISPAPRWALRMATGEMADPLLLYSARVEPAKLLESDHRFEDPELGAALQRILRGMPSHS